ncbi:DUF4198 domain-containing protein [Sandaracinobacter sp. RS1-74]|uniref:DUF4198 domain-containing protein n=1 Tax=Sandaracinobacteroides sayramensis TaxID=2913411 RepID=UPI001EDB5BA3|nr:DUF4198 domain-containing protein [Sandaracinobacteroides sayramensis]MCG2842462.1 DUF4198 domain-containing protein [Sandaracinobacteroides sayramensis]
MFRKSLLVAALLAGLSATPALAHRQWLLPSATVLSGDKAWVTVDAAISNDLFYFEHFPMQLANMKVWQPDGSEGKLQNPATGRYRSVFDVELNRPGTWKIGTSMTGVMGSYKENGEEKRLPRGTAAADLPKLIPAGATDVKISENSFRNEIFVTAGAPTTTVLKPSGKGLEVEWLTHPNDLVAGESAKVRFLADGKPAAGIEVELVPGGIRYRDKLNDKALKTDANGVLTLDFATPGMYWMEAQLQDDKPSVPGASQRRLVYISTMEVLAP